jgi:secondary thiamine-phosphate synthase enzyme
MKVIDKEINLHLKKMFTPFKVELEKIIKGEKLKDANIVCWVPHEVASLIQIGWESGLLEDLEKFLSDIAPSGKWTKHDEPGTPFRENFHEHIRTKLVGQVSMTFIVKNGELYLGKYQDIYFYSSLYKDKPNQKVFCRILKFDSD